LIGPYLSLQCFQNFRPFPFVFFGVEIALVAQPLNIVQALLWEARWGSERGLAKLALLSSRERATGQIR